MAEDRDVQPDLKRGLQGLDINSKEEAAETCRDSDPLLGSDPSTASCSSHCTSPKQELITPAIVCANPDAFDVEMGVNEAHVMSRVNRHILPIFFALAMLCSIDRANLSFAATQLNHDLEFSKSVYGYGSGIFFVGYAVMALPTPFICDKIGAPLFLGSILIVWGFTATLFAFMTRSWHFFILRFLLGVTESGAYPGMWYHLALFYTDKELGLAYTIVSTASSLSGAAGGPIASFLLRLDGAWGFRGWQWLFLLEGIPPVLLGMAMIFFLARDPATAHFLLPSERQWLVKRKERPASQVSLSYLEKPEKEGSEITAWASLVSMLSEWRMWWLSAIWMIVVQGVDCMVFWIPLMLRSMLYGEQAATVASEAQEDEIVKSQGIWVAQLSVIPFAAGALGMLVVASIAKKTGERHWCIILSMLLGGVMLAILPVSEAELGWLGVIILSVACAGVWGPHGPLLSWPAKILDGTAAAAGFALIKTLGSFSSFAGNAAMGKLHDVTGGFAVPTYMLASCMVIGIILTLTFKDHEGNRAMGVSELAERLKKAAQTRPAAIEYNLSRDTASGATWKRMGSDNPDVSSYSGFEMPDIPPIGSEDLTYCAYLHRRQG